MKLAISVCEGRVSNVFDFAQKAMVVELREATESDRVEVVVSGQGPARMARLRQLGVDTLICGAISRPLASAASVFGIRLLPYVTGSLDEVIEAYRKGFKCGEFPIKYRARIGKSKLKIFKDSMSNFLHLFKKIFD